MLRPLQLHGRGEEGDQVKGAMCVLLPWALRSLGGGRSHRSMLADGVRCTRTHPGATWDHVKKSRLPHPQCGEVSNVPSRVTGSVSQSADGGVSSENSHFVEKETEAQRDSMTCLRFVPKRWGTQARSQATPSLGYPAFRHWTRRWRGDGDGDGAW